MKRKELIAWLMIHGCLIEREGKKHSLYFNPSNNKSSTIPRHTEINTFTAKGICKDLEIPIIKMK